MCGPCKRGVRVLLFFGLVIWPFFATTSGAENDDGDDRIWGGGLHQGKKVIFPIFSSPHTMCGALGVLRDARWTEHRTGKEILESSGPPAVRSSEWRRINYDKVI